jgi:hypothetical protein
VVNVERLAGSRSGPAQLADATRTLQRLISDISPIAGEVERLTFGCSLRITGLPLSSYLPLWLQSDWCKVSPRTLRKRVIELKQHSPPPGPTAIHCREFAVAILPYLFRNRLIRFIVDRLNPSRSKDFSYQANVFCFNYWRCHTTSQTGE